MKNKKVMIHQDPDKAVEIAEPEENDSGGSLKNTLF